MLKQKFSFLALGLVALLALTAWLLISSRVEHAPELKAVSPQSKEMKDAGGDSAVKLKLPSFVEIAKEMKSAVVNISTTKLVQGGGRVFRQFKGPLGESFEDFFGKDFFEKFFGDTPRKDRIQKSLGSGFIIDKEGYILTNNHVIEKADKIMVKLSNEKEFKARVIGLDSETDLALIKIDTNVDLPLLKLGDSDKLETGEWVIAVGNPFGLEHTVTAGIVSAKGRVIGAGRYDDFIQTDASINFGNSGGPLINSRGAVVGINTAIVAGGQGIGFAIPINMAKKIIPQLKNRGKVIRGWLGISIQDLTSELARYYGVKQEEGAYVAEVIEDNPADMAGMKAGDIVIDIDGHEIRDSRELLKIVASITVGRTVIVKVLRDGKEKTLSIKAGERPERKDFIAKGEDATDQLGLKVRELTPEIVRHHKLIDSKGVMVTDIKPDSLAEQAGIKRGDIVKEINHRPIDSFDDYISIMKKMENEKKISFLIRRDSAYIAIEINR